MFVLNCTAFPDVGDAAIIYAEIKLPEFAVNGIPQIFVHRVLLEVVLLAPVKITGSPFDVVITPVTLLIPTIAVPADTV